LFSSFAKFNLLLNTHIQSGVQINLDLYSIRSEFETRFRDIVLIMGYENFFRDFSGEKVNYNNVYLRIGRYF